MKTLIRVVAAVGVLSGASALAAEVSAKGPQASGTEQEQAACCCGGSDGMMRGEMGCPRMRGAASVAVENTSTGAVIRLTAKDSSQIAAVQRHAQMMERCMSGGPARDQPGAGEK